MWIDMKRMMWKFLHPNQKYGHCHLFIKKNAPEFKWEMFRKYVENFDVLIVTGNTSSINSLKIGRSTHFLDVGTENAFDKLSKIKDDILLTIKNNELNKNNVIVFASLGPTACILAHDLLCFDIRVWDTGHMFEFADKNFMEEVFNGDNYLD
jgi:hypothetical protein